MGLARALAVDPKVLLLDEPFGALDARVRQELREWLRRLHDEMHVTTVFVTHDQEEAMQIADEIVLVNRGRIEQVGSPRDLYERPANEFVLTFVGEATQFGDELVRPHDIVLSTLPEGDAEEVLVERVTHFGFDVRVQLALGDGHRFSAQLTRDESERLELASGGEGHVKAEAIARAQGIPLRFLEQILLDLKHAGVVASQRGAEGGYWLARPPAEITLAEIIRAVEGPLANVRGVRPEELDYGGTAQPLRDVFIALRANVRAVLEAVTLADVAADELPARVRDLLRNPEAWSPH